MLRSLVGSEMCIRDRPETPRAEVPARAVNDDLRPMRATLHIDPAIWGALYHRGNATPVAAPQPPNTNTAGVPPKTKLELYEQFERDVDEARLRLQRGLLQLREEQ
eukprot:TRINITY_DN51378_c0_g1_i1.p1 TRINITY_DN51378_c0_g1~~TRINITY_DN51378_c0_g1_i1.p1  ORF type:complete len:106 (-),score=23.91 TRINITY_DN51378_c0_g1_i1:299-616(-)